MCAYASTARGPLEGTYSHEASMSRFPSIHLHTVHGLTGKQLLHTMECPAPDFTASVVEWYINNFDTFRPRHDDGDEIAQCRFYVTLAKGARATPDTANRLNLPTLLIELLSTLGLPPIGSSAQPDPIHLQVNLLWLQTMDVRYVGIEQKKNTSPSIIVAFVE